MDLFKWQGLQGSGHKINTVSNEFSECFFLYLLESSCHLFKRKETYAVFWPDVLFAFSVPSFREESEYLTVKINLKFSFQKVVFM